MIAIKKLKNISQLKKNLFSGAFQSGINILVTIVSYPIYLNYLGTKQYGLWAIVSVVLAYSQIGQMGIATALTKNIAYEYGKRNFKAITEYITTSFYILLIPSLIIMCILAVFKNHFVVFIGCSEFLDDAVKLMFWMGPLTSFSLMHDALRGIVAGIGRMDIACYVLTITRIIQVLTTVCLLKLGYGVWSLYFGSVIFLVISFIGFLILLKFFNIKTFSPFAFKKNKTRKLLSLGGTLLVGTLAHMFILPFNKLIISKYVGLSEVTYYQIANNVVSSVRNLFAKGLQALLPEISNIHGKANGLKTLIISTHTKGLKFVLLCAFPIFLLIFIFADQLLKGWLARNFDIQILFSLRILLVGWYINLLSVPDYFLFIGVDKAWNSVCATCLRSGTSVVLITIMIFVNMQFGLLEIVLIDSICISSAVVFLKYKYFRYKSMQ